MKSFRSILFTLMAIGALALAGPSEVESQVGAIPDEDCRCVDKDGNEIENCRCFRTLEPGRMGWNVLPFGEPRARIGITLAMTQGEEAATGAHVMSVLEDGPAERAGIREGDIITHVNGHSLFDPLEGEEDLDLDASLPSQRLLQMARELEPGDEVEIGYLRDGEGRTATVEAEELDDWGGNVMFFGDDREGSWDMEEFGNRWKELGEEFEGRTWSTFRLGEPGGEGEVMLWTDRENPSVMLRRYREGDSPEVLYRRFEEGEPEVLLRRFEEGEPRVLSIGPEGRSFEIDRGGAWEFGGYFNTCPSSDEDRNLFILGTGCIGGLRMEELNPKLGEYFATESGVLITDVHEDSKLGLQAGDVILGIGDWDAEGPDAVRRIFRSYEPDEEITLRIMRQKREMTVTGMIGR